MQPCATERAQLGAEDTAWAGRELGRVSSEFESGFERFLGRIGAGLDWPSCSSPASSASVKVRIKRWVKGTVV